MKKVSIIVPIYNSEKYLKKCLDSLINQRYAELEIILINDGSIDNSINIINSYADERIVLIEQKNQGQAVARNNGIKRATGDYLLFVDSDDWVDEEMILNMVQTLERNNYDIVVSDFYRVEQDKQYHKNGMECFSDDNCINFMLSNPGPCFKLFKTKLFIENELLFLEGHIYEDLALIPAIANHAQKIGYIKQPYYYYNIHDDSTTNQAEYNQKLEDIYDVMYTLEKRFDIKYKEELEYIFIRHFLLGASLRFSKFSSKEAKENLKKISNIMHLKYPKWKDNKYIKFLTKKELFLTKLFYNKCFIIYKLYRMVLKK